MRLAWCLAFALVAIPEVQAAPRITLVTERAVSLPEGTRAPAHLRDLTWPIVYRGGGADAGGGGPEGGEQGVPERVGPGRVGWGGAESEEGGARFELFFGGEASGRARWVAVHDRVARQVTASVRIPAAPGGEPRVYLSDRDALAAFTVDYGTWDTCPEIRGLRPEGLEVVPLACPEAGEAAVEALRAADLVGAWPDPRTLLRLRLTNIRYVDPGFLAPGGVDLDATLRLRDTLEGKVRTVAARFRLVEGRIQGCRLLGR